MTDKENRETNLTVIEGIEEKIHLIRGQKVMLDNDLAIIYGVETKMLNRAVKRNLDRFPMDFMFQLTDEETKFLRFQFGTSNKSRGGRR
jgi:ORF6N domain